jgi:hypothetical protein
MERTLHGENVAWTDRCRDNSLRTKCCNLSYDTLHEEKSRTENPGWMLTGAWVWVWVGKSGGGGMMSVVVMGENNTYPIRSHTLEKSV